MIVMDFGLRWKEGTSSLDQSWTYEPMSTVQVDDISRSKEKYLVKLKYNRLRYSVIFVVYSRVSLPKYLFWIKIILKSVGDMIQKL